MFWVFVLLLLFAMQLSHKQTVCVKPNEEILCRKNLSDIFSQMYRSLSSVSLPLPLISDWEQSADKSNDNSVHKSIIKSHYSPTYLVRKFRQINCWPLLWPNRRHRWPKTCTKISIDDKRSKTFASNHLISRITPQTDWQFVLKLIHLRKVVIISSFDRLLWILKTRKLFPNICRPKRFGFHS